MNDTMKFFNTASAATTTLKSGAGRIGRIVCNTPVASAAIAVYDNTAGSGTTIATITLPATLLNQGPATAEYNANFKTGLTIVTTGTANWTVAR